MGSIKDLFFENQEADRDTKLAAHLGITTDELGQTDFHFDEETDSEGSTLNDFIVFTSIPDSILKKIRKSRTSIGDKTFIIEVNEI